jgi:hypothetical protein
MDAFAANHNLASPNSTASEQASEAHDTARLATKSYVNIGLFSEQFTSPRSKAVSSGFHSRAKSSCHDKRRRNITQSHAALSPSNQHNESSALLTKIQKEANTQATHIKEYL